MDKFKTQSNLVELSPDYSLQSGGGNGDSSDSKLRAYTKDDLYDVYTERIGPETVYYFIIVDPTLPFDSLEFSDVSDGSGFTCDNNEIVHHIASNDTGGNASVTVYKDTPSSPPHGVIGLDSNAFAFYFRWDDITDPPSEIQ